MAKPDVTDTLQAARTALLFNLAANLPTAVSQGNTTWEELTCVGFNPQLSLLEAVVSIKQSTGYSGGLCTAGSPEYVRFFVDYGAGFQDAGVTSFRAHDISDAPPGPQHPIEYLVQLPLDDAAHRRRCYTPAIPRVRAVLSWNQVPSLNPNDVPTFGNRLDAHIQLRPRPWIFSAVIADGLIKADPKIVDLIDLDQAIAFKKDTAEALPSLVEKYKKADVPAHRFLAQAVQPLIEGGESLSAAMPFPAADIAKKLAINWAELLQQLQALQGNTTFEQLTCVGLDTDTDTLGAVIHVKRPFGYSGDLCHNGSREYVAFWADWNNNGTFDEYLGTAAVEVHDLEGAMPPDGVRYSVKLNAPQVVEHLRRCSHPNIIRIRAVLQWATPPSTTNPNAAIGWGNRLDVLVQLRPGRAVEPGELIDLIYRVGGVGIPDISTTTHLAFPSSVFITSPPCSQPVRDRPWGGGVNIQGRIYNTGLPGSVRYRVRYKLHSAANVDANWVPVTFAQSYTLMFPLLTPPEVPVSQTAGSEPGLGGGWFDYIENPLASPPIFERDNMLASWSTGVLEGAYDLRLEYRRTTDPAGFFHSSNIVTIMLHNTQMTASAVASAVIDFTKDLDLVIDGGDCHSYKKGVDVINGHLRCVDQYFWLWSLDLQPATHTNGAQPVPQCRTYASLADSGDGNQAWTLDTSPMDKCGYTLTLRGYDRTIIDSGSAWGHHDAKAVGFSVV